MPRLVTLVVIIGTFVGCQPKPDAIQPMPIASPAWAGIGADATAEPTYTRLPTEVRTSPRATNKAKFGPPPPGYFRIVGGAVPGWQPEDMFKAAPRGASWHLLGPRPIIDEYWSGTDDASGRVVSIAPHPSDPNTVYIASASGGIWKTVDKGSTWVPLTDELATLNHGAVALDPSNPDTVYAGTGEYTTGSNGDGLFRSTDGGQSWIQIATEAQVGGRCSKVAIAPDDPLRIYVTGSSGCARSTDGGNTWTMQITGSCSDLALNPLDPSVVYVAQNGIAVYRSLDGGDSFIKLTNGLPTDDVRRILLAIAPSNPDVVYTAIINSSAGLRGLYRSADGGDSWVEQVNTPDFPYPQGWYDACIAVDPTDEDVVYAGGVFPSYAVAGVIKTMDGGASWTDITIDNFGHQLHPDQHTIAFGPDGTLWVGNDGGVWKSITDGQAWLNTNATLTVTQNYQIALHPSDPAQLLGGTQDNGTVGRELDVLEWPQVIGGDGGFAAYDHEYPIRRYTTYVYLTVFRAVGGSVTDISGPWDNDSRGWIAPLVMAPDDPYTLYGGTNRVWRTNNAHENADWTPISGTEVGAGGTLTAIAVAPSAPQTIYTGSTTGKVFVTADAAKWFERSAGLPGGQITDICVALTDPGRAYVAFNRTTGTRIARTDDYGVSWSAATGDLPYGVATKALDVDWRFDPPHLYCGCGAGVYESHDGGVTWTKDGSDLPNVNIGDIRIDFAQATVTAGTYGRGAWRKDLPPAGVPGDLNCDGAVDGFDIDPFVLVMGGQEPHDEYYGQYPNCDHMLADVNGDGLVNGFDIDAFVGLLGG
ncbi:MAG: hypothetical protein KKB50_06640 [Planctomycetes bacterium]|nr:hypothetical protein [Planctomycetota bacterium]